MEVHGREARAAEGQLVRWSRLALLVTATILLVGANLAYWVQSTLLDSDEFTSKVDSVIVRPEAADRIGAVLADQALSSTALQDKIAAALPENASILAVIAENPIADLLGQALSRAIRLQATRDVVLGAVRELHSRVVAILEGKNNRLDVGGNEVVLHLDTVLSDFLARVGIEAPQGGADTDAGKVVLVHDTKSLSRLSRLVKFANDSVPFLFAGSLAGFTGVVLLSREKWRGLTLVSYGVVAAGIAVLVGWRVATWSVAGYLDEAPVARMMIDSLANNLRTEAIAWIVAGGLMLLLFDPRMRAWLVRLWNSASSRVEGFGHGRALLLGAAGLVVVVLVT